MKQLEKGKVTSVQEGHDVKSVTEMMRLAFGVRSVACASLKRYGWRVACGVSCQGVVFIFCEFREGDS